jgi:hypothetical protein
LRGGIVTGNALSGALTGNAGLSSRRCHGLTTRGVRADRVGVALSFRTAARQPGAGRSRQRELPGPWPVKPRLVTVSVWRREASASCPRVSAVLPVLGAGSVGWLASAEPVGAGLRRRSGRWASACSSRSRRRRAGRAERASARWLHSFALGAGIGRSRGRARGLGWLQKSTSGAWSRFARTAGLALWHSCPRLARGPGLSG